jgi:hypothetical protein
LICFKYLYIYFQSSITCMYSYINLVSWFHGKRVTRSPPPQVVFECIIKTPFALKISTTRLRIPAIIIMRYRWNVDRCISTCYNVTANRDFCLVGFADISDILQCILLCTTPVCTGYFNTSQKQTYYVVQST